MVFHDDCNSSQSAYVLMLLYLSTIFLPNIPMLVVCEYKIYFFPYNLCTEWVYVSVIIWVDTVLLLCAFCQLFL